MLLKKQHGFSLLELVVALGVIAILYAICMPGLQGAASSMHQSAAELKLLSWQANGVCPSNDRYYSYHQGMDAEHTSWSAIATHSSDTCGELTLTDQSRKPAECWPK